MYALKRNDFMVKRLKATVLMLFTNATRRCGCIQKQIPIIQSIIK